MHGILRFLAAACPYISMGAGLAVCVVYGVRNNHAQNAAVRSNSPKKRGESNDKT